MIDHPNAVYSWLEYEIEPKEHKIVLVIETDLELRSDYSNYDSSKFDDLMRAAIQAMEAATFDADSIRIVPQARGNA